MKKIILFLILISIFSTNIFSQNSNNNSSTEPLPYEKDEFPLWLQDVRDTEIIMLGSFPFVMIGVSLTYSFINVIKNDFDMSYFSSPFSIDSSFEFSDQKKILLTTAFVSAGIGFTNLMINLIKRKNQQLKSINDGNVVVTEISGELVFVPIPKKYLRQKNYLYGNLESAVF